MLRILTLSFLALLCEAQDIYTIAGHVVRHTDRLPLPGVRVSISMAKETSREVSVISGENGEFAFQGIPAGKYHLQATAHGATYSYLQSDQYSTAIVAGPNLDTEHIVFPLEQPASIVGKVVDEENEPAPNLQVYLFHQSVSGGKTSTSTRGGGTTNSRGSFHFRGLEPGIYYLAVVGRVWYSQGNTNPALDLAYPVTFYADATSAEGATPLKLEEGQKADVEMIVRAVPSLHIKLDGWNQRPGRQGGGTMLTQAGPGDTLIRLPVEIVSSSNTNSELVGIAPGKYTLAVGGRTQIAALTSDAELPLSDGVETIIKGRLILDGGVPGPLPMVNLTDNISHMGLAQQVKADGTFELPGAHAGHYTLMLTRSAPDLYAAKVETKGASFVNGELDVVPGAHVELLITPGHGLTKLEGVVEQDKKPMAGAMVLLIPKERNYTAHIGRDQSDSDGTFAIAGLAPGRYTLIAIDDGHDLAYVDPAVIAPYLQRAQVVDIPMKETAHVEVQKRLQ